MGRGERTKKHLRKRRKQGKEEKGNSKANHQKLDSTQEVYKTESARLGSVVTGRGPALEDISAIRECSIKTGRKER